MVKVSVIMPVFRPGGLDITFASLRDQTCRDFELILVDLRYEKRHKEVMDLAQESGVPTVHVPEHRRNGKWAVVASAWNTGFMLSQGEIVLMLPDYAYAPPDWIEKHLRHHDGGSKMVLSPYVFLLLPHVVDREGHSVEVPPPEAASSLPPLVTELPGDNYGEITIFRNPFNSSWLADSPRWPDSLQCQRLTLSTGNLSNHVHFRNESLPLSALLELNGADEHLDRGKAWIDLDFGLRLANFGCQFIADMENLIYILNPRTLFPTAPQGVRWTYDMCEYWSREQNAQGFKPAPNPYSLKEKRASLLQWRNLDTIPTEGLDIPDEKYYGGLQ